MDILFNVGIIGIGVLGNAIFETLNQLHIPVKCYDKYKYNNETINNTHNFVLEINELLDCNMVFLCLPTPYINTKNAKNDKNDKNDNKILLPGVYDKSEIYNVINVLNNLVYKGIIIIKSTVEPGTTDTISNLYPHLCIIHNPEFLTARTATIDFQNQSHIVIGIPSNISSNIPSNIYINNNNIIIKFYKTFFTSARISICSSNESECMKIACNAFYATKIQFFTEIKLLCDVLNISYDNVKMLMLNNGWINPNHTNVPGSDNNISFGGMCLPKDTNALNAFMNIHNTPHNVINAVITEQSIMRDTML